MSPQIIFVKLYKKKKTLTHILDSERSVECIRVLDFPLKKRRGNASIYTKTVSVCLRFCYFVVIRFGMNRVERPETFAVHLNWYF